MSATLDRRLEAYFAHRLPHARAIRVDEVDRIVGGASRQTYRFRVSYELPDESIEHRLILRRDPAGSVIETDRRREFYAYQAFHGSEVPVPEPIWLEEDPTWLDQPFFVMQELVGLEASPAAISQAPYSQHLQAYGEAKWTILGRIARANPKHLGLTETLGAPALDDCWRQELDYWEGVIDADALSPWPIVRAAIRWLRRNPPATPSEVKVVHGDYRTGNFLYDDAGGIHGILDWEMVHLGDPLEDLAWSLSPLWDFARNGKAGSLLPREAAIGLWEKSSGLRADPEALHWWEVFAGVKGQAIWISAGREFIDGQNRDPIMGMAGISMFNAQDRALLQVLGHLP